MSADHSPEKKPFEMNVSREWVERMVKAEEECGDITVGSPERAQSPLEQKVKALVIKWRATHTTKIERFPSDYADCADELEALLLTPPAPERTPLVTPGSGNVFTDLGFPPAEAEALKAHGERLIAEGKPWEPLPVSSERTPAEGAEPQSWATLQLVAKALGWGNNMTDEAIYDFVVEREQLLRVAQELLETQQSHAPTAEAAIRDRVSSLRERAEKAEADSAEKSKHIQQCHKEIRERWQKLQYLDNADREVARLQAALSSLQAAGWQPIETAPKDGRRVLMGPAVWTSERVVTAYYRGGLWWIESADIRGSMRAFTDPDEDATHWPFRFWQPIPTPPAACEGQKG